MRDDFAVFIITHRRPDKQMTYKTLRKGGYTGRVYFIVDDEDPTVDEYKKNFGENSVEIFHKKNNFDLGDNLEDHKGVPVYARNACFDIAEKIGITYFVQMDDDYPKIDFRYKEKGKLKSRPVKNFDRLFTAMCIYLDIENIYCLAFAVTGDFIGGVNGKYREGMYQNARNTFFCRTDKKFEFLGRINEDVTTPAWNNSRGKLFFTILSIQVTLYDHEKNTGGSSEQYRDVNLYWNYFYPVLWEPSAISIRMKKKGFIKHVKWNNLIPKIVNEKWRKER
jgi:hypothetical protein